MFDSNPKSSSSPNVPSNATSVPQSLQTASQVLPPTTQSNLPLQQPFDTFADFKDSLSKSERKFWGIKLSNSKLYTSVLENLNEVTKNETPENLILLYDSVTKYIKERSGNKKTTEGATRLNLIKSLRGLIENKLYEKEGLSDSQIKNERANVVQSNCAKTFTSFLQLLIASHRFRDNSQLYNNVVIALKTAIIKNISEKSEYDTAIQQLHTACNEYTSKRQGTVTSNGIHRLELIQCLSDFIKAPPQKNKKPMRQISVKPASSSDSFSMASTSLPEASSTSSSSSPDIPLSEDEKQTLDVNKQTVLSDFNSVGKEHYLFARVLSKPLSEIALLKEKPKRCCSATAVKKDVPIKLFQSGSLGLLFKSNTSVAKFSNGHLFWSKHNLCLFNWSELDKINPSYAKRKLLDKNQIGEKLEEIRQRRAGEISDETTKSREGARKEKPEKPMTRYKNMEIILNNEVLISPKLKDVCGILVQINDMYTANQNTITKINEFDEALKKEGVKVPIVLYTPGNIRILNSADDLLTVKS